MTAHNICPLCDEGSLCEYEETTEVEYKGHTAMVPTYFSVCDACGAEQASAEQLRNNKRLTIAFRKAVDSLLTGTEAVTLAAVDKSTGKPYPDSCVKHFTVYGRDVVLKEDNK